MKKKNKHIIRISALATLSLAIGSGYFLALNSKSAEKAEGYSTSSLPTTIDLNDTSAANIRSYYSSLNNMSQSERQGTNLLKNLKTILKNGQKYYSYDSGNAIWDVYCIVDRDWDKSPASSLPAAAGTYNESTNKITGYNWGGNSSTYENPYLHALYYNRDKTAIAQAYGDHSNNTSKGINREHIWPKGAGFDGSGQGGARGDIMHLWAANGHTNNIHSNNFYGYVDTSKSYTDIGSTSTYSMCAGNLSGKSKTFKSSSNTVFEPQDSDKGDIARACFYMVARYNYLSGSDSDGINANNPNLELVNNVTDFQSSGYTSTTSNTGKLGILQDLLEWNRLDPPDEFEIHRNNLCYNNFTNNRNPFIDFPEWAEYIWGKSTNGSYNSASTGYATPSSDVINGYSTQKGITKISKENISLVKGNSTTIYATSSNSGNISWSSSNTSVATVSKATAGSGETISINAVNAGSTTITASITIDNTLYTANCDVTVSSSSSSDAEGSATASSGAIDGWTASGTGSAYADGSVKFDTGGDCIYKTDIFSGDVSQYMTSLTVTINGKINGTPTATNSYKVEAITSTEVVKASDTKTGVSVVTTSYGDTVFSMDSGLSGTTGIRITYVTKGGGNWGVMSISWAATYSAPTSPTLSSISLDTSNATTVFTVNDTFTYDGLSVTAYYSDGSSDIVTPTSVSSPNMSSVGQKTVTVSYTEGTVTKTAQYTISVIAEAPTSITATVSKTYYVGETITSSDITVQDNLGNNITTFAFADDGYQFIYADAASGGSLTNKTFTSSITYSDLSCSLTVQVQRKAHEDVSTVKDTITATGIGVSDKSYSSYTGKTFTSNAIYSVYCMKDSSNNIQMKSKDSVSGVVSTTSGGTIQSVKISVGSGSNIVQVYAKNTAYSSPSDLYSNNASTKGTFIDSTSTTKTITFTGSYTYVGIKSSSGAIYLSSIEITYGADDTATNLANYIMYEDTDNQCDTKYSVAKGYFENLTKAERTSFMTSGDYVIATARERLEAWARNQGQSITQVNGDYAISSNKSIRLFNGDNTYIIALAISMLGLVGFSGYFFFRFRKREE